MKAEKYTYLTVITNEKYLPGVYVLAKSLESVNSKYELTVLVPNDVNNIVDKTLIGWGLTVKKAQKIDVSDMLSSENKASYWGETFFKLRSAGLTEFKKIVLLDSDMIVLKNIDHLFLNPHMSAVAAGKSLNPSWKKLNSGTLVLEPSEDLIQTLISYIPETINLRQSKNLGVGDQDVFNYMYPDWPERDELHMSETYNALSRDCGILCSNYIKNGYDGLYIVHFIGREKPWDYKFKHIAKIIYRGLTQKNFAELRAFFKYRKYLSYMKTR